MAELGQTRRIEVPVALVLARVQISPPASGEKMKRTIEKPEITEWLKVLSGARPNAEKAKLYKQISLLAAKPRRSRVVVNLMELNKVAKSGSIIVPGKVLGTGEVKAKFSIAAIEFSGSAKAKLEAAGCNILSLKDMLGKENVKVVS